MSVVCPRSRPSSLPSSLFIALHVQVGAYVRMMWVLEIETLPVLMINNLNGLVHTSIMEKCGRNFLFGDMYLVWRCFLAIASFLECV
jgi:hypothetical protein